jgi:hypothetical protein
MILVEPVRRELRLLADYHQIHVCDEASENDLGEAWTEQAVDDCLAVNADIVGIRTEVNVFVSVSVEVLQAAPSDDSAAFDHVVEASFHNVSGRLVVMGCTDYMPDAERFAVPSGWLRLRAAQSNLPAASRAGVASDEAPETIQRVRLQVWPAARDDLVVIKRWSPEHGVPVVGRSAGSQADDRIAEAQRNRAGELDLSHLGLDELPESLGGLVHLTRLFLYGNRLTALPEWIGRLTALTGLHLAGNRITALPQTLGNLTAVTALDLSGNQLTVLPQTLGNLTVLTELQLGGNKLTTLPDSIGRLTRLTRLILIGNQLTALPESIGGLTALRGLHLGNNQLTALPESFGNLTALTDLHLGNNQLTALPESFGNLTGLRKLFLGGNRLAESPDFLDRIPMLRY